LRQKRLVRQWLHSFVINAGKTGADVNYVFCGDEYLYRLNLQFLNHDTYTDILTFPDFGEDMTGSQTLRGECYISTERVRDHAVQMGISHADELHRVMVHGILHLLGQGDKTAAEQAEMRRREDRALACRAFQVETNTLTRTRMPVESEKITIVRSVAIYGKRSGQSKPTFHVEQVEVARDSKQDEANGRRTPKQAVEAKSTESICTVDKFHVEQVEVGRNAKREESRVRGTSKQGGKDGLTDAVSAVNEFHVEQPRKIGRRYNKRDADAGRL